MSFSKKPSSQSLKYSSSFKNFHRKVQSLFPRFYKYEQLIERGHEIRPQYAYCLLQAAQQANKIGINEISVLEFGCAGGAGLVDLEYLSQKIQRATGVKIKTFGFDFGEGLPSSSNVKDCLYLWGTGDFPMNKQKLMGQLSSAEVIFGDVANTVGPFLSKKDLPPIGFISIDLDYFSSTLNALKHFSSVKNSLLLPRTYVYLDDTLMTSSFTGELFAVETFNQLSKDRKIDKIPLLAEFLSLKWRKWQYLASKIYWLHSFDSPLYSIRDIRNKSNKQQLPL